MNDWLRACVAAVGGFVLVTVFGSDLSCSQAVPPPGRVLCYGQADERAQARVNAECQGDAGFEACESKAEILIQLKRDQEACP